MNQQNKTERWVEEFDKRFDTSDLIIEDGIHQAYDGDDYAKKLKSFISQLLSDAMREERERCLEALPVYEHADNNWCQKYDNKYKPCVACLMDMVRQSITTAEESIKNLK